MAEAPGEIFGRSAELARIQQSLRDLQRGGKRLISGEAGVDLELVSAMAAFEASGMRRPLARRLPSLRGRKAARGFDRMARCPQLGARLALPAS
jgi:hypothetical protein